MAIIVGLPSLVISQDKQLKRIQELPSVRAVEVNPALGTPSIIELEDSYLKSNRKSSFELIESIFQPNTSREKFANRGLAVLKNEIEIETFQQSIDGIPVEHGTIKIVYKFGHPSLITAEKYQLAKGLKSNANLSMKAAKSIAMEFIGANVYAQDVIRDQMNKPVSVDYLSNLKAALDEVDPKGQLVWVDNYNTKEVDLSLAYKFNIYGVDPLSRDYVYVDANNGKVLLRDAIIKHGTGETRYNNTRTYETTELAPGDFQLLGVEPVSGVAYETRSMEGLGGTPLSVTAFYEQSVAISDSDDNWTAAEHRPSEVNATCPYGAAQPGSPPPLSTTCNEAYNDDVALDAHWGGKVSLQYWQEVHNRKGFDGNGAKLFTFVHYGDGYDNAFWNGSVLTFGDGSYQGGTVSSPGNGTGFSPLTSLDVVAHEFGHAICEFTSNLVYQRESGAMNEGFSDLWGASVERYVVDILGISDNAYDPWGIGEQIDEGDGGLPAGTIASTALRWMDDPQAAGDPDTYGGNNWSEPECGEPNLANDNCGVHTNSGVLNKWFYFLVEGSGKNFSVGSGRDRQKGESDDLINDIGTVYSIAGLGFEKAEQIAFLTESLLSPNAKFADARNASISAARILYSVCGPEEISVTNAWNAVGVGDAYVPCASIIQFNNEANGLLSFLTETKDTSGCTSYTVDFSIFSFMASETISLTFGGTATKDLDYSVSTESMTFNGTEIKNLGITILDDAHVEVDETIIISFTSPSYTGSDTLTLIDDDFIPVLNGGTGQVLLDESFENGGMIPTGWSQRALFAESQVNWFFNAATPEMEGAFVSDDVNGSMPMYTSTNIDGHVLLLSPEIDARGLSNVRVQFDWTVGGEFDGEVFDYGSFVISYNGGQDYTELEQYYSNAGVGTTESGSYDSLIIDLNNSIFTLGFKWYNDVLVSGGYSFAIDDVLVTADAIQVETAVGGPVFQNVVENTDAHFVSSDGELISKIGMSAGYLGCTESKLLMGNSGTDTVTFGSAMRSSKVFGFNPANSHTYDVTIYFRASEVEDFDNPTQLNILYNTSNDVGDMTSVFGIISSSEITVDDQRSSSDFIAFTATIPGDTRSVALTDGICNGTLALNGNPIADGDYNAVTITSKGIINSNSNVTLTVSEKLILDMGFTVEQGALLDVYIGGCL